MMSSTNEEDPFLQVQQDVLTQMQTARPLFASYLRIRSLSTTPSASPEVASARADLETALTALAEDLADLVGSVQAAERDPTAFGLSAHEVARRKRLVQEIGGEVEDMREELSRTATATGAASNPFRNNNNNNNNNNDLPPPSAFAIDDSAAAGGGRGTGFDDDDNNRGGNDRYTEFEQQQQVQMMREQDQELDGVFTTVGNLRRQADDMGRELEEQHEMLGHVDTLAERVGGRLQTGVRQLGHIMRRNEDRYSGCCVAVLIMVLIILLVLLLVL